VGPILNQESNKNAEALGIGSLPMMLMSTLHWLC